MGESTFTFRVDESLKNEFAQAAKAQDRTGAQLLRDFMRDVVRRQRESAAHGGGRREGQEGGDLANAGDSRSAAKVEDN
jgi:predicted transcriptional regulator